MPDKKNSQMLEKTSTNKDGRTQIFFTPFRPKSLDCWEYVSRRFETVNLQMFFMGLLHPFESSKTSAFEAFLLDRNWKYKNGGRPPAKQPPMWQKAWKNREISEFLVAKLTENLQVGRVCISTLGHLICFHIFPLPWPTSRSLGFLKVDTLGKPWSGCGEPCVSTLGTAWF